MGRAATRAQIIILIMFLQCILMGQVNEARAQDVKDSVKRGVETVTFTPMEASEYISGLLSRESLWTASSNSLRYSLRRLTEQYLEPFDSVRARLSAFPFDTISFIAAPPQQIYDTIPIRWLSKNKFISDLSQLERDPIIIRTKIIIRVTDLPEIARDTLPVHLKSLLDSLLTVTDTITEMVVDTQYLASRRVTIHQIAGGKIVPPVIPDDPLRNVHLLADSSGLVVTTAIKSFSKRETIAPLPKPGPELPDSLNLAVNTLLSYLQQRDSLLLYIRDIDGRRTPLWMSGTRKEQFRFWAKNYFNDSITIWVGNPEGNEISLHLDEGVNIRRPEKMDSDAISVANIQPVKVLAKVGLLEEIPYSWKYGFVSSVSLNQNHLSNWAKGGVSSLSTMIDILVRADYRNRKTKEKFTSTGRVRYGSIRTREQGFRTSNDILEFNSQYNKVMIEKIDFSTLLYMKSQVARGYQYPNDSVVVSRFLNPGTFTIGLGAEYKPFSHTTINWSPFSYKITFVLDTANINQSLHGVESDKRVKQEIGSQLLIRNNMNITDGFKMSHSVRLFSSYLNKPQNIDVDWEMGLEKEINWYFTIRFNLHLIYDDDIRFPVLDSDGAPVLLPDGSPRQSARTQFNQFLGVTLSFRL